MDKTPVNVRIGKIELFNLTFDFKDKVENKAYDIEVKDSAKCINFTKNSFELIYQRFSNSVVPFSFSVQYRTVLTIVDTKELDKNNETIQDFAERKKIDMVNRLSIPSKASLLIGNITKDCGGAFITIPTFIK